VGFSGVTALPNGNYVVSSQSWANGDMFRAGAVTFGSGTAGISGAVSPANSLVGSAADDSVGNSGAKALINGNYVVSSPNWDNGAVIDVGAVTFGSGTSGITGVVSPTNSLVGSTENDYVGASGVTPLANGNYVVRSRYWRNGAIAQAGAVTFGSGTSGITGDVSPANSLVGGTEFEAVGISGATALTNGSYVVSSPDWDNGAIADAGAVTFGTATSGITGVVSLDNSLVGSAPSDAVGSHGVAALTNGSYVVSSPDWDNGAITNAGAVTFGAGDGGVMGLIVSGNSLIGSTSGDQVGSNASVTALANGNYVVNSADWDNGAILNAGAVTLGLFNGSAVGAISSTHSVLGAVALQGAAQTFSYDARRNQLAVGQPASNRVVLQRTGVATAISIVGDAPDPSVAGHPVTFTATVTALPDAPTDGQVTFSASSGENCVDTTPTAISPTTVSYACTITFAADLVSSVVAEYTGSIIHAFSGSTPEAHTTVTDAVFANGFEGP
jgi:hypothetical protein